MNVLGNTNVLISKNKQKESQLERVGFTLAPQVGLEPTAYRLTVECSTTELLGNINVLHRKLFAEQ